MLRSSARPLTIAEITHVALQKGILVSTGMTPERTMATTLYARRAAVEKAGITRSFEAGPRRARRGSVHWMIDRR